LDVRSGERKSTAGVGLHNTPISESAASFDPPDAQWLPRNKQKNENEIKKENKATRCNEQQQSRAVGSAAK
jgi:hypothetical protein